MSVRVGTGNLRIRPLGLGLDAGGMSVDVARPFRH